MPAADGTHLHWPYRDLLTYATLEGQRRVETATDWEIKRGQIERAVLSILGPFPTRRCPLEPWIIQERTYGDIVRRTVEYAVAPGERVLADLTFPAQFEGRLPVILALHGTNGWIGKDSVWELPGYPDMELSRLMPAAGYAVVVPDGPTTKDRQPPGIDPGDSDPFYALNPGWSIMGQHAYEAMRALDYIETLDFLDASRVGAVGHSLGGYWTMFTAAFDPRIAVAVSSCGFVPFRTDTNGPGNQPTRWARAEGFNHMPALAQYYLEDKPPPCDFHEIMALMAPRPFLNVSGWHDLCFQDASGIPEACDLTAGVYSLLGVGDRFECHMFDGPHDHFELEKIQGWFDGWLKPA